MNRKAVSVFVAVVIIVIILVIVLDFSGNRPDRRGDNPYEYSVEQFRSVDASLVHFRETRNFPLEGLSATAIDINDERIWLAGEGFFMSLTDEGRMVVNKTITGKPTCIEATDDIVYLGFEDHIETYGGDGTQLGSWEPADERSVFTSLARKDTVLFVADAGNRRVIKYGPGGRTIGTFEGKRENEATGHGFIVPSACFDLVVNDYGELWVVNPGMHAIENYSDDGKLRGYWQKASMQIDGFTGCCNPAEIDVLEDGSFVTAEKGLVRIKIYDQSGKLLSVVAPPEKFEEEGKAPEVKVDGQGRIWSLDFDRKMIRLFERIPE